jgi:hypothetical protein
MARIKNIEAFCNFCSATTKMELAAGESVSETENKRWAKCKKCKHTMLITLEEKVKEPKVSLDGIENENFSTYSPAKTFQVGESIYHEGWNDFGKIIAKDVMSNGKSSITVEFQKTGIKKLIESLTI